MLRLLLQRCYLSLCASFLLAVSVHAQVERASHTPDSLPSIATNEALVAQPLPTWGELLETRLGELLKDPSLQTTTLGLCIYNLTADTLVYAYGAERVLRPASTMKVITAVAALRELGGAFRYATSLRYTGAVEGDTLHGDLYLVGSMDPLFDHDDMLSLVSGLQRQGIRHVQGILYTDNSLKDTTQLGQGWCWDDNNPRLTPLLYQGQDRFVAQFMRKASEAGISLPELVANGVCPPEATLVDVRHHTIDEVLRPVLKQSRNLHAETLFYHIGAKSGRRYPSYDAAQARITQWLTSLGNYHTHNLRVADGSGLSLYNYVTPRLLVDVLRYAYQRTNLYEHLTAALPIAGVDGTLSKRMASSSAHYRIQAKTGTLEGVISLAGYADASNGNRLAFAIITNGTLTPAATRRFHDNICVAMTE